MDHGHEQVSRVCSTYDSSQKAGPPRPANAFLEWYCADDFLEEVQGDLHELYGARLEQSGTTKAKWWYCWDVLRFFRPYLLKRKLLTQNLGGPPMFKNYLKIAFRNLLKHKGYSLINIAGLVTGLTACILILLYVQDELSYDKFHLKADRTYRVNTLELREGRFWHLANNYGPAAPALMNDFPDIEQAVRLFPYSVVVERDQNRRFQEDRFMFTDSSFFEVFSFVLKHGDLRTALRAPDEILITETTAQKYFGDDDPMGKILTVESKYDFKVSGVLQDLPSNSHFHFDFLAPISSVRNLFSFSITNWHWPDIYTYIVLPPNYPLERMEQQFPDFVAKNIGTWAPPKRQLALQPLTAIRLHSNLEAELEPTGSVAYIYILATIAFFILIIACINFMNLATARSANRAKEVGLRKVVGAQRFQLVNQFFGESMFYAFLSLLLAIGLVEFLLPYFNLLVDKNLDVDYLENWTALVGFAALTALVGLFSGSYPAMFLSQFRPIRVLKANSSQGSGGQAHSRFRSVLVVVQFAISISLIVNSTVIKNQLDFIRNKKLGFGKDQIVAIPVRDGALQNNLEAFKNGLLANSHILAVTGTSTIPGIQRDLSFPVSAEGVSDDLDINFHNMLVDHDFVQTFEMEVLVGRDFDKNFTADTSGSFILNETAVAALGWESPLHKRIEMHAVDSGRDKKGRVIGVVRDFHFRSLHHKIDALILTVSPQAYYLDNLAVRVHPSNVSQALELIEAKWREVVPNRPFEYQFLDSVFEEMYRKEKKLGQMFDYFAALAIFVGCLGLFGLASYTAEQRTKEIGIRKVLGASTPKIVLMLSKELVVLIAVAFVIASPLAYYAMNKWLQEFVYRVNLDLATFVWSGALALGIALLTISYQALKAALANPVDALRYQ